MKFTNKMPTTDTVLRNKLLSQRWTKIKEPSSSFSACVISIPFALLAGFIFCSLVFYINPSLKELFKFKDELSIVISINANTLLFLFGIYAFALLHELIHAVFIPNAFKSNKVFIVIKSIFGFVYTTEKISKFNFLVISIMPFILLSIVLPVILNFLGLLNIYTFLLCFVNALGSCVDLLTMFLISIQVPNKSYIITNGFETYFKGI